MSNIENTVVEQAVENGAEIVSEAVTKVGGHKMVTIAVTAAAATGIGVGGYLVIKKIKKAKAEKSEGEQKPKKTRPWRRKKVEDLDPEMVVEDYTEEENEDKK